MGGRNCCVKSCRRRSHDRHGRRLPGGLTFHCFPAWRRNEGSQTAELTKRRREAWVAAVGRSDITFSHIPTSMRVCSRHFPSGKPAYEMLESDPDWVPSLLMGHSEGDSRHTERLLLTEQSARQRKKRRWTAETRAPCVSTRPLRASEAAGGGPARRAVPPWRDVKSLLQSVLQRQTDINKTPGDQTHKPPAAVKKTDLSFRDFFRDALEASLDASSRSRALSAQQTSVTEEYKVELNFKLPPLTEEKQPSEESPSSSSCVNCVRLQRRIMELQEKLSHLPGEEEDTERSPVFNQTPLQPPDQDLQSPERVHMELEEPEWMEPLSPPQWVLHAVDQGEDLAVKSTHSSPAVAQEDSPKHRLRRPPRFRKSWLKMFWFLHYSTALDQMWCHVCRLHADKTHQNLNLIKGSQTFKLDGIKKHSKSKYHKENVERHMLQVCNQKL
ncbi:uncharacterized protein [Pagrus major]|uniref:uncharacterized protein n=1 Tax=Pagrus major TaxID=143350 RepID=UPI003CC8D317